MSHQREAWESTFTRCAPGVEAKVLCTGRCENGGGGAEGRGVIFHGPVLSGGSYQQLPV